MTGLAVVCPSMQVACPHCTKTFEPERPGIQFCPHCGGQLDVPLGSVGGGAPPMGSILPGSTPGSGGAGGSPPWERRAELGFAKAFFETFKQCLLSPPAFFATD